MFATSKRFVAISLVASAAAAGASMSTAWPDGAPVNGTTKSLSLCRLFRFCGSVGPCSRNGTGNDVRQLRGADRALVTALADSSAGRP